MAKKVNVLRIVNILLVIAAIFLVINLILPLKPITGGVIFSLDERDPLCTFERGNYSTNMDTDICCLEVQKLLKCENIYDENYDFICYTSKDPAQSHYLINSKTYNYCISNGFNINR